MARPTMIMTAITAAATFTAPRYGTTGRFSGVPPCPMVPAMDSDPSCPFPVGAGAAETILVEASAETLAAHPADRVDRWLARCLAARGNAAPVSRTRDRTSGVWGKSGTVRCDLGG